MKLKKGEHIVTAYAQPASGPGWANRPTWIIVRGIDGKLREECLQPEEQSAGVLRLYHIAAVVHAEFRCCVEAMLRTRKFFAK